MKASRLLLLFLSAAAAFGCSKDVTFHTRYVIKPLQQLASDDHRPQPVEGATAFVYNVDTTEWYVAAYDDALKGVLTSRENPSEKLTEPYSVSVPFLYEGAVGEDQPSPEGWLEVNMDLPTQMVVTVDPVHRLYAYTQQELIENLHILYATVLFQPWKTGTSYTSGKWVVRNDFYVPPQRVAYAFRPQAQAAQDGAATDVENAKIYAYAVDTTRWWVPTYEDAVAGRIYEKGTENLRGTPEFSAYRNSETGRFEMEVTRPEIMVVAVDREHQIYAYTNLKVDLSTPTASCDIVFRPWREEWRYADEGWSVTNSHYAPQEPAPSRPTSH